MRVELPLPSFTHFSLQFSLSLSLSPVHLPANFYSSLPSLPSFIPGDTRANARESNIFSSRVNCSRPRLLFVLITPERLVPRFHKIVRQAFFQAKRLSLSLPDYRSESTRALLKMLTVPHLHGKIFVQRALSRRYTPLWPSNASSYAFAPLLPVIQTHVGILRAQRQIFFRA